MNKETETRKDTLTKWSVESLANIARLIIAHPEIEDDVLEDICQNIESEELGIYAAIKEANSDPEAPLYKIEVMDINADKEVTPPTGMPVHFSHKATAYKTLNVWEDVLELHGCIGLVKPVWDVNHLDPEKSYTSQMDIDDYNAATNYGEF